ncbi:hypothetical protein, partial [Actinoplanes sp. TBRC 11911]|uniref:hypothetical protein n=1 Tax=Actinoplanes sp. TBRC 11911 TaxID=2729386 RepID=UPI001B7D6281
RACLRTARHQLRTELLPTCLEDSAGILILLTIASIAVVLILVSATLRRATIVISGDDAGRLAVRMLVIATFVAVILAMIVTGRSR